MRSERQRIRPKLKELCDFAQEWMDDVSEEESLRDWYALFKKLEYLLYDIGMRIFLSMRPAMSLIAAANS